MTTAAHNLNARNRRRFPAKAWFLYCDDCHHREETAIDMHEHTLTEHGRRITDRERTPRKEGE